MTQHYVLIVMQMEDATAAYKMALKYLDKVINSTQSGILYTLRSYFAKFCENVGCTIFHTQIFAFN